MERNESVTPGQKWPASKFPFGEDFETILTLIGDGVISTDQDGRIILFNKGSRSDFWLHDERGAWPFNRNSHPNAFS